MWKTRILMILVLSWIFSFLPSYAVVYHAHPSSPSSFCDCVLKLTSPGDECRLHTGTYFVGPERCNIPFNKLHGTFENPIIIAAAGDGSVIIDGTITIEGPWKRTPDGRHYQTSVPGDHNILQFFASDGNMKVLARYPNAGWKDKSMFLAVENWFRSSIPGVHNLKTGEGILRDTGSCSNMSTCCARCNANDLAKSGINATGALAIMNLWSCDTGVQKIKLHDANNRSVLKYDATWVGLCDKYRGGDGRYYLEGTLELLDHDEEWLFDNNSKTILVASKPVGNTRGRVSDYALVIEDASFLEIANISFHATTLSLTGNVSNLNLRSLEFNYSSISRRSLGDISPPITLSVCRDADIEHQTGVPGKFLLDDVVVRYSDGPALLLTGDNSTLRDCLFEWNDYSTVGGSWPIGVPPKGKASRATTCRLSGDALTFERLTFRNNGAAQSFNAGGENKVAAKVEMCYFESQLAIQDDGSFVEGGGTPSTVYIRNWGTNTGKGGLRWDGYYPGTLGGMMMQNVIWNATGLIIKGDQHNVTQNTVFDGADITPSHANHDHPHYQDHLSSLDNLSISSAKIGMGTKKYDPRANQRSTFSQNFFDSLSIAGVKCPSPPCKLPGKWIGNLVGIEIPFDVRAELRDPYHRDFRPCPTSRAANMSVGAYEPKSGTDNSKYWIPGRRERRRDSSPLPPHESIGVHLNSDLMFRPPALNAISHSVFIGKAKDGSPTTKLKVLDGDSNVATLGNYGPLKANTRYVWRVDTTFEDGSVENGDIWMFLTGSDFSCHIIPHPPPKVCTIISNCTECKNMVCPGESGKGQECMDCVLSHTGALDGAGCFNAGGRHAFIEKFCGIMQF